MNDRSRHDEGKTYHSDDGASGLEPAPPLRHDEPTFTRLEEEADESHAQVAPRGPALTAADAELPIDERRELGIRDNARHVDSIGQR